MLKILQASLQQYVNSELPDVEAGFRKGRGTRDQIANICWIIEKAREFQKNIHFCFIDYATALTYVHLSLFGSHCSMSSSNCCFLTCIQISQEAGQIVWYSHFLKNFSQFAVINTVKSFGIVNKAEVGIFSGTLLLFQWSSGCWQFDFCFLCLF